jgi:hypothetical protein
MEPCPAPATTPAMASDSSGSSSRSDSSRSSGGDSRYSYCDARRFKEERDATRHELEIISKQAGIAELEWQHGASSCSRPLIVSPSTCSILT